MVFQSCKKAATIFKDDPKIITSTLLQLPAMILEAKTNVLNQLASLSRLETSYSHETYFENNQGFKQAELLVRPIKRTTYFSPTTLFLSRNIAIPQLQQSRGFKTKRAQGYGGEENDENNSKKGIGNIFAQDIGTDNYINKLKSENKQKIDASTTLSDEEKQRIIAMIALIQDQNQSGKNENIKKQQYLRFSYWIGLSLCLVILCWMVSVSIINKSEIKPEEIDVRFDDVKGCDESKEELMDVVEFLTNPQKFSALGGKLPKGVILSGPPGTGKTLLAKAVAGEAVVPFFHMAGSEFDEMFVGQGARRVRDLFKAAKEKAPCVNFIDEIDSVGSKRSGSELHPYANQTINQLLSEMDGFKSNEGVIVLGATNRIQVLDKALLRPGRFDTQVVINNPDIKGRKEILQLYFTKCKCWKDLDIDRIAKRTVGMSGADLQNLVNTSAIQAAKIGREFITMADVEFAYDKQTMGIDLKSRVRDEDDIKITAYHEAGHTLVAHYTNDAHPIHKVTIIAKGQTGGHTAFVQEKDQWHRTKSQILAMVDTALGGRTAEELVFGKEKITGGASHDLTQSTSLAEHMVQNLGMSEKLGLRVYEKQTFLDGQISDKTKDFIDAEINTILNESKVRVMNILKTHRKELNDLAEALITHETLDGEEVKSILKGKLVLSEKTVIPVVDTSTKDSVTKNQRMKLIGSTLIEKE